MNKQKTISTKDLVGLAMLTAIVVVLQLLGSFIRFGVFSISLVLLPIVIGSAVYGVAAGAWLGLTFGVTVLLSGDASVFLAISPLGTILTVLVKGVGSGLAAGLVYRGIRTLGRKADAKAEQADANKAEIAVDHWFDLYGVTAATIAAAIAAPIANTGIFLIGCCLFFMEAVSGWGQAAGFENVGTYMIVGFVGLNFLFEMLINVVLSPAVVRLLKYIRRNLR